MSAAHGVVYLVGAGPGDPGLITVRGLKLIRQADVVVYDRLVATELLAETQASAELIYVGKTPGEPRPIAQEDIHDLVIDRAKGGLVVVRLKGGDPFVFGRGFEEFIACRDAGVDCIVVPGVTSALAAPEAAGIPLTLRYRVRSLALVTAQSAHVDGAPPLDFKALAGVDAVIILMGHGNLEAVAKEMICAGRAPITPAACIERATMPQQRTTVATLATIADAVERDGLMPPVVTVVGEVAAYASTVNPNDHQFLAPALLPG